MIMTMARRRVMMMMRRRRTGMRMRMRMMIRIVVMVMVMMRRRRRAMRMRMRMMIRIIMMVMVMMMMVMIRRRMSSGSWYHVYPSICRRCSVPLDGGRRGSCRFSKASPKKALTRPLLAFLSPGVLLQIGGPVQRGCRWSTT